MEVLISNLDLILSAAVILISAVIFARRGQIELLRELILSLSDRADVSELYERLPGITKMLVSNKTVLKLSESAKSEKCEAAVLQI